MFYTQLKPCRQNVIPNAYILLRFIQRFSFIVVTCVPNLLQEFHQLFGLLHLHLTKNEARNLGIKQTQYINILEVNWFIRQDRNYAKSNYQLCHVCPFLRPSVCLIIWLKQDDNTKQCSCPHFCLAIPEVQYNAPPHCIYTRDQQISRKRCSVLGNMRENGLGVLYRQQYLPVGIQSVRYFRQASSASKNTKTPLFFPSYIITQCLTKVPGLRQ